MGSSDCLVSTHRQIAFSATVPYRVIINSKDQQNIQVTHDH